MGYEEEISKIPGLEHIYDGLYSIDWYKCGDYNHAFKLENGLILRIRKEPNNSEFNAFENERLFFDYIREHVDFPIEVPQVVRIGKTPDNYDYSFSTLVEGETLSKVGLKTSKDLPINLGEFLEVLHSKKFIGYGTFSQSFAGDYANEMVFRKSVFSSGNIERHFEKADLETIDRILMQGFESQSSLVHFDLNWDNILLTPRGTLGIIDAESSILAPREAEFAKIRLLYPHDFFDAVVGNQTLELETLDAYTVMVGCSLVNFYANSELGDVFKQRVLALLSHYQ